VPPSSATDRRSGRATRACAQDDERGRVCRNDSRYRAHRPRRRLQRSPAGSASDGFTARAGRSAFGVGADAADVTSTVGSAIGSSTSSAAIGLTFGGRPRRGFGERFSKTSAGSGSTSVSSGEIKLGRIRRVSAVAACGAAGGGQDTAGRGATGATARWRMMGRWRPPDLVSTVNDRGERLRMGMRAFETWTTRCRHEDVSVTLTE
jgi:hypothetical protein